MESVKEWLTLALLALNAVLIASRWVANREAGERITKKDLETVRTKLDELCDWQTDFETRYIRERREDKQDFDLYAKRIHEKFNELQRGFGQFITRVEHDKDIAHIRELLTGGRA